MTMKEELKQKYPDVKIFVMKRRNGFENYIFYLPVVTSKDLRFGGSFGQELAISSVNNLFAYMLQHNEEEYKDEEIWAITNTIPLGIEKNGECISVDSIDKKLFLEVIEDWIRRMGIFNISFERVDNKDANVTTVTFLWGGYNYILTFPFIDNEAILSMSEDDKGTPLFDIINYWVEGTDVFDNLENISEVSKKIQDFMISCKKMVGGRILTDDEGIDDYMLVAVFDQLIRGTGLFDVEYEII